MRRFTTWIGLGIGIVTLTPAGPTHAALIIFFGEDLTPDFDEDVPLTSHPNADAARDAFDAMLINNGVADFEEFPAGAKAPITLTFTTSAHPTDTAILTNDVGNSGSVVLGPPFQSPPPPLSRSPSTLTYFGRYSVAPGAQSQGRQFYDAQDPFTLRFNSPQAAIGFYGTDIGDFVISPVDRLMLTLSDGVTSRSVQVPHSLDNGGGSVLFFGLIDRDNPFTQVGFGSSQGGFTLDVFGFDSFTIARADQVQLVPEPASLNAFALGITVLIASRRRRARPAPRSGSPRRSRGEVAAGP